MSLDLSYAILVLGFAIGGMLLAPHLRGPNQVPIRSPAQRFRQRAVFLAFVVILLDPFALFAEPPLLSLPFIMLRALLTAIGWLGAVF